jgi:hypothetical protein
MWGEIIGGVISAAGQVIPHLLPKENPNETDWDLWRANYEMQKEFAQNGLRWKVEDAQAAGLHPLIGAGASGAAFSPSFPVGGSSAPDYSGISSGISKLGQGIGRAIDAKATEEERLKSQAYQDQARELDLVGKGLENQRIESDIALNQARTSDLVLRSQQQVPAMPSIATRADGTVIGQVMPGQGNSMSTASSSPYFTVKPAELVANTPGHPGFEAGSHPEVSFLRTVDGGYAPARTEKLGEVFEDDWVGSWYWNIRNRMLPVLNDGVHPPPNSYLPGGNRKTHYWDYSLLKGAWYPEPYLNSPGSFLDRASRYVRSARFAPRTPR